MKKSLTLLNGKVPGSLQVGNPKKRIKCSTLNTSLQSFCSDTSRKKVKLQTYVRATTSEEYIEVERTEENGQRSYKVEARLEPLVATDTITEQITMRDVK